VAKNAEMGDLREAAWVGRSAAHLTRKQDSIEASYRRNEYRVRHGARTAEISAGRLR